ncbi:MAG: NtaA/DmoA family FMN-dependent monooxygenase [Parvibaculaceae bacterium]
MSRRMHIGVGLTMSHLNGRWRTPGSWVHRTYPDLGMFEDMVRIAERGCLDMVFFGDATGIPATWNNSHEEGARWGLHWPRQDMSPYIGALSQVTKHIGFGLTYASTFMPPFYVARLLNSLDHITNGRIAFNVVTSSRGADAANYGFDQLMDHDERYERMEEFIHVCKALWDSIEPDAFLWNRATGEVVDPSKVHRINHVGKHFKVAGPLSAVPSPQRHPVLIQAGMSPRGHKAAASFANLSFADAPSREARVRHRKGLDAALIAAGRDPRDLGIMLLQSVIVGETKEEARAKKERMLTLFPEAAAGPLLSYNLGFDLSKLPERFSPAELNAQIIAAQASPSGMVARLAEQLGPDGTMTRKEFFQLGLRFSTGYERTMAGTVAEVADYFEAEFEAMGECGGFMVDAGYTAPRALMDVVDHLIPELQRRGRFRKKYQGRTLREHLAED